MLGLVFLLHQGHQIQLSLKMQGLFFQKLPKTLPLKTPSNTVESLATFRQQLKESHHDLVNMLTQQMATIFTLLIESTNTRYDQLARQVNRIAGIVNVDENPNNPIIRPVVDA